MQIKIEIDVKPEELRRFLGLPDIAGLQDDLVEFLKEKLGAEQFDPAGLVRDGAQLLRDNGVIKRLLGATKLTVADEPAAEAAPAARARAPRPGGAASASGKGKRAPRPAPRPAASEPDADNG